MPVRIGAAQRKVEGGLQIRGLAEAGNQLGVRVRAAPGIAREIDEKQTVRRRTARLKELFHLFEPRLEKACGRRRAVDENPKVEAATFPGKGRLGEYYHEQTKRQKPKRLGQPERAPIPRNETDHRHQDHPLGRFEARHHVRVSWSSHA